MTHGNIKYPPNESQAIIDEVYNTIKSIATIPQFINENYDTHKDLETNMQDIEKKLDRYINKDPNLQLPIASIYHRRNIMIPVHHCTEKNESIDAKKRLIREVLIDVNNNKN